MAGNNYSCKESYTLEKQSAVLFNSLTHNLINKTNKANNISLYINVYKTEQLIYELNPKSWSVFCVLN